MDLPGTRDHVTENGHARPVDLDVIAAIFATSRGTMMRRVALTISAPILAATSLALNLAYSSPAELWASLQPVPTVSRPVTQGGSSVHRVVESLSVSLPAGAAAATDSNADCFQDLAIADSRKLDRCSRYVYQALIEIERDNAGPTVRQALEARDQRQLVQQLKLAATEVCRLKWARGSLPTLALTESPACEVSQVRLASDVQ